MGPSTSISKVHALVVIRILELRHRLQLILVAAHDGVIGRPVIHIRGRRGGARGGRVCGRCGGTGRRVARRSRGGRGTGADRLFHEFELKSSTVEQKHCLQRHEFLCRLSDLRELYCLPSPTVRGLHAVTESVVLPPDLKGVTMTEIHTSTLTPRAVARPRCPQCQARALVQRATAARPDFEHWTLRCTKCGHIHEAQVRADPMTSEATGWLSGELRSPT